jgi:hypothetical protein
MGSVGVGGSVAILLLIGFVVGAVSSWLFFWWQQRRAMRIEVGPDMTDASDAALVFLMLWFCLKVLPESRKALFAYGNDRHGAAGVSEPLW